MERGRAGATGRGDGLAAWGLPRGSGGTRLLAAALACRVQPPPRCRSARPRRRRRCRSGGALDARSVGAASGGTPAGRLRPGAELPLAGRVPRAVLAAGGGRCHYAIARRAARAPRRTARACTRLGLLRRTLAVGGAGRRTQ